jgi:putative copper export protein
MTDFVAPSSWELAGLLCQLSLYLAAAALAGTALNIAFYNDGSRATLNGLLGYGLLAAVLGFHAALLNYLVQVGMLSGSGVAGMFDLDMASLLIDTPQGERTFWRLLACMLALVGLAVGLSRVHKLGQPPSLQLRSFLVAAPSLAIVLLAFSFRSAGHVSILSPLAQTAIVMHVLAFAAWIGSLLPLHWLTRRVGNEQLHWLMHRFGDHARVTLVALVASGVLLLWELLQSPVELWRTAYGQLLSVKLLLVVGLMGLAAKNRFTLVPQLIGSPEIATRLARSIRLEMLLALLILVATAYLSTLVGPASH